MFAQTFDIFHDPTPILKFKSSEEMLVVLLMFDN